MTKEELLDYVQEPIPEFPSRRPAWSTEELEEMVIRAYNKAIEDCSKKLGIINTLNDLKIK